MMNTNKFLLGGLVAVIAIVSVQITNQVQIRELIKRIDTVTQYQASAILSETDAAMEPTIGEDGGVTEPSNMPTWWHNFRCKMGWNSSNGTDHCTDAEF